MGRITQDCPRCGLSGRLQKRVFSDQATSALLLWGDLSQSLVGEAICDDCYGELRNVLIDRSTELSKIPRPGEQVVASQPLPPPASKKGRRTEKAS